MQNIKAMKDEYKKGTIIELVRMGDDMQRLPAGSRGVVSRVDDMGTIHMNWDSGSSLGLIKGEDEFRVIGERVEILIDKETHDEYQALLDEYEFDLNEHDISSDSAVLVYSEKFSNGFEVDIKICSGQDSLFVDPVLFNQYGHEIGLLDVTDEILGEYEFEYDNKIYIVNVKLEP